MKSFYRLCVCVVTSFIGILTISAAEIEGEYIQIDGNYCYKNYYNSVTGQNSHSNVGSKFITVDGLVAYCVNFNTELKTGTANYTNDYLDEIQNNKELYDKISLIGHFGYNNTNRNSMEYYLAAQMLIWQEVTDAGLDPNYRISGLSYYTENTGFHAGNLIDLSTEQKEILESVDKYYEVPSFCGKEYDVKKGESLVLTDTNEVLGNYSLSINSDEYVSYNVNKDKLTLEGIKKGNRITISFDKELKGTATVVYAVDDGQQVVVPTYYPEVNCAITVNVTEEELKEGYIQVKKVDKDTSAPLEGVKFSIYNSEDEVVDTVITDENGIALSQELPYGKYYILEVESLDGYILNKDKIDVEINNNDIFEVTFTNEKEVIEQVQTSDILIGVVWAIGLFCLGLGIHYYTEYRKKES